MVEAVERLSPELVSEIDPSSLEDIRFSYSRPEQAWWQRALIRSIEMLSGQPELERLYRGWSASKSGDENIFAAGVRLLELGIETNFESWSKVPKSGPVLFVANHPFGVADGLIMGDLVTRVRPDAKIMTHSLLCQPPEARDYLLPVDFGGTPEAQATSVLTRRRTLDWLQSGHSVVVFPAGGVATAQQPFAGPALESAWHPFVGKLARMAGVTIVPVFFHGQNSRAFHIASHVNYMLRVALIFRETARRRGSCFKVTAGEPFSSSELRATGDRAATMTELRRRTLALGGSDAPPSHLEFRFPSYVGAT